MHALQTFIKKLRNKFSSNKDIISWLEDWYHSHCDGEWEHDYGVDIGTLDNPGWSVSINLKGTNREHAKNSEVKIERNETDWVYCFIRETRFEAAGGPKNLQEMLHIFRKWIMREEDLEKCA